MAVVLEFVPREANVGLFRLLQSLGSTCTFLNDSLTMFNIFFPMFVLTFLLKGGLYHVTFMCWGLFCSWCYYSLFKKFIIRK